MSTNVLIPTYIGNIIKYDHTFVRVTLKFFRFLLRDRNYIFHTNIYMSEHNWSDGLSHKGECLIRVHKFRI